MRITRIDGTGGEIAISEKQQDGCCVNPRMQFLFFQ